MKLHHTKYKENYKRYILDSIDEVDYEGKTYSDKEKIEYIFDRFNSEYGWAIERYGKAKAMRDWLAGLSMNIPYMNWDIIELAIDMGSIDPNPTDKIENKIIENYFSFMANIILGFEPKKVKELN